MPKRKETKEIECLLEKYAKGKRLYGCEEVTIGFFNAGHGNEICDYVLMDAKGIVKCYEIKVTASDLKSHAKKSWYGNYNYLVITENLVEKLNTIELPEDIGIIVGIKYDNGEVGELKSIKRSTKRDLSDAEQIMIKESMIRSMMWKIWKYKNVEDIEHVAALGKENKRLASDCKALEKENYQKRVAGRRIEKYIMRNTGVKLKLNDISEMVASVLYKEK